MNRGAHLCPVHGCERLRDGRLQAACNSVFVALLNGNSPCDEFFKALRHDRARQEALRGDFEVHFCDYAQPTHRELQASPKHIQDIASLIVIIHSSCYKPRRQPFNCVTQKQL